MPQCSAPTEGHTPGSQAEKDCKVHGTPSRASLGAPAHASSAPAAPAGRREPPDLDDQFEFDSAYAVNADGEVESVDDWVPGFYDDEVESNDWEPISGLTGQYGYNGPVMHVSETLGGGPSQYMIDNPGTYAIVEAQYSQDADGNEQDPGDSDPAGWVLLRKKDEPAADAGDPYADAVNPETPAERVAELARESSDALRVLAAEHPNAARETLRSLSGDRDWSVRLAVAGNKNADRETLEKLSRDKEELVVQAVAANDSTPAHVNLKIAETGPTHNIREMSRDVHDAKVRRLGLN